MDERDQTQIRSSDSFAGPNRSGARRQPASPASQPAPDQPAGPPSPAPGTFFDQTPAFPQNDSRQPSQSLPPVTQRQPSQFLPPVNQGQPLQPRSGQQPTEAQAPIPQPIVFAQREDIFWAEEEAPLPPVRRQRLYRTRRLLRSRVARVVIPLLTLLIGLAVGLTSVIWYGLSGEVPPVATGAAAPGNLVVNADKNFVSQLVSTNLTNAGLPGRVENVSVQLEHGALIIVQGDDVYPVFFFDVTKHFTVDVQPYVTTCVMQVRITHADLSGIPVTTFVQTFQGKINQQLAKKPTGLPNGFTYCTVGVSTEPTGMLVTYEAIPVK